MSLKLPGETNVGRLWYVCRRLLGKLLKEMKEGWREEMGKSESTLEANERFLYTLDRWYFMAIIDCVVITC